MTKKLPIQTITDKDILNEVIVAYDPKTVDLCEAFDVSRQMVHQYKIGEKRPSSERLVRMAQRADFYGDMARRMLDLRGLRVAAVTVQTVEQA